MKLSFIYKTKKPKILFFHGSGGVDEDIYTYINLFSKLGHDVYASDHNKICKINPKMCKKGDRYLTSLNRLLYDKEKMDAKYKSALRLRSLEIKEMMNKFYPEKVILAGTSEGAIAVAKFTSKRVIGKILLSYGCGKTYFTKDKLEIQKMPVLNIIGDRDEFFGKSKDSISSRMAKIEGYKYEGGCPHLPNIKVKVLKNAGHSFISIPKYYKIVKYHFTKFLHDLTAGTKQNMTSLLNS